MKKCLNTISYYEQRLLRRFTIITIVEKLLGEYMMIDYWLNQRGNIVSEYYQTCYNLFTDVQQSVVLYFQIYLVI